MEKKVRIKLEDLPKDAKITQDELKKITGGAFDARLYTGITRRKPWVYADGPCFSNTFCY